MAIAVVLILLVIGLALLRTQFHSRTAFVLIIALEAVVSLLMALGTISIIGGITIAVFAGLLIIWLDERGSLA